MIAKLNFKCKFILLFSSYLANQSSVLDPCIEIIFVSFCLFSNGTVLVVCILAHILKFSVFPLVGSSFERVRRHKNIR